MNDKIKNLIDKEKERLDAFEKQRRDTHLKNLGIIDESKTERKYIDYYGESAKYDQEKQAYYIEEYGALDVTDEEYEEICKYFPVEKKEFSNIKKTKTGAEITLNTIAIIVLVCGIIGTLICFLTIATDGFSDFEIIGFLISIGVLLTSLITWSVLKIICEIAAYLRQIHNNTT